MPGSNRLDNEIEGVFGFFNQFLKQIEGSSHLNREESISAKYHEILDKKRPWLTALLKPESPNRGAGDGGSQSVGKQQNLHTKYLMQIERNPAEKAGLIKEFLEYFPEISVADRAVLAANFLELTYKELYQELENLTQIFQ